MNETVLPFVVKRKNEPVDRQYSIVKISKTIFGGREKSGSYAEFIGLSIYIANVTRELPEYYVYEETIIEAGGGLEERYPYDPDIIRDD